MRALIEAGAELAEHSDGYFAIHRAALQGHYAVLDYLVSLDPRHVHLSSSRLGVTPLMSAASRIRPFACEALLENGASVDATDREGKTALHHVLGSELESVRRPPAGEPRKEVNRTLRRRHMHNFYHSLYPHAWSLLFVATRRCPGCFPSRATLFVSLIVSGMHSPPSGHSCLMSCCPGSRLPRAQKTSVSAHRPKSYRSTLPLLPGKRCRVLLRRFPSFSGRHTSLPRFAAVFGHRRSGR